MDLAPRVAAKVKTGLTAHCTDLYIDKAGDKPQLIAVVPGWGGNLMVKIACPEKRPQMATVKPGVMEKPDRVKDRQGQIIRIETNINDADFRARTIEIIEEKPSGIPLDEADIIVAGGWGLESVGGFELVEELAEVLGGAVGGTRPAVDKGWLPEERMIGSSGKTVSPKFFISAGASGAMHFTTGFLKSKVILAIDKNPKAPIFEVCDLGIVGDLGKIIPCLVGELKAAT
ncbi:electron transfer flavoprotein subunit alpha/FixB family protein [Chloroflexota bacterium]